MMKTLIYASFLFSLIVLFSCSKKEQYLENEKISELNDRLQGEWISTREPESFHKIIFQKDNSLKYYISAKAEPHYTASYQLVIEDETILRIRRPHVQNPSGQEFNFDHPIYFEGELLHIKNIIPSIASVVGISHYGNAVFKRAE